MYTYTLTAVPSHVTVQRLYIETDPDAFIYGRYAEQKHSLTFSFGEASENLGRQPSPAETDDTGQGILKGRATDTEEETERIRGGDNTETATWTLFSK